MTVGGYSSAGGGDLGRVDSGGSSERLSCGEVPVAGSGSGPSLPDSDRFSSPGRYSRGSGLGSGSGKQTILVRGAQPGRMASDSRSSLMERLRRGTGG